MKNLQMGKKKFNMDPKKGIEYLVQVNVVKNKNILSSYPKRQAIKFVAWQSVNSHSARSLATRFHSIEILLRSLCFILSCQPSKNRKK